MLIFQNFNRQESSRTTESPCKPTTCGDNPPMNHSSPRPTARVAIIGGGPAGLMATEILCQAAIQVDLYDAMPSLARKFLLAGKGGLNLTHAEPFADFVTRYGTRREQLAPMLTAFGPAALRSWTEALGIATFVGSSGRVFPREMKAAPLLRAWLHRLRARGLRIHVRHRWQGWAADGRSLRFATPQGSHETSADAVVLALGGGSWPQLGSDGAWIPLLREQAVRVCDLRPANCGFDVQRGWSPYFRQHFAGQPLKSIAASFVDADGHIQQRRGECLITDHGIEGSLIYALSAKLRDTLATRGSLTLLLDLLPDWPAEKVIQEVQRPRGARSLASHLQSRLGLKGVRSNLLRELLPKEHHAQPERLAAAIKALPLPLTAPRPLAEAISSAGGIDFAALDERLMLRTLPGVFCAGEMLDWEAPTGGYLLTACFATGHAAAHGVLDWLASR